MGRRAFLHIGTPKSGTTYLQSLWWHNKEALARNGLLLPGGSADEQFQAAAVIRANSGVLATMGPRQLHSWDRIVDEIQGWSGDSLISQEQLVEASSHNAAAAVARLREVADEVHVVITARDLVRQVPSAWQQRVKHGSATTLRRFFQRVAKDDPDFNFWHHQDVPRILQRWSIGVPPEHVHVVVLPRPGAPKDLLWQRTCGLLGIDDAGLSLDAPAVNETLAPAEIAFARGVNAHFPQAHLDVAMSRRIKGFMEPRLGGGMPVRLALPADMHAWLVERGGRMVDDLAAAPWHVLGDLDDLRSDPEPGEGTDPDAVPDADVLAVAEAFVAAEVLAYSPSAPPAVSRPLSDRQEGGAGTAQERVRRWVRRQRGTNAQ